MKLVYFHKIGIVKDITVGSASHMIEFTQAMKKLSHQVIIYPSLEFGISNGNKRLEFLGSELKKKIIYWIEEIRSILENIFVFFEAERLVNQICPDVILIRYQLYYFATTILAKIKRIPVILEINAPMAFESRKFYHIYFQLPYLAEWTEKLNLRLADAIITVSEELKSFYVKKGIPTDKIYVIPNGANVSKFYPVPEKKPLPGLEQNNKVVIGFIGTFNKWHGISALKVTIETISKLKENVKFLLIGDGPLKVELEKYVIHNDINDSVTFTGIVPHEKIPDYITAMDIVLAPYPRLDFFYFSPLKIFEYMSSAKAVIATKIGQIKEIIQDGVNGFLYEPDNQHELIEKLLLLIENKNLRLKFGQEARQTIIEHYTWTKNAEKVSEICLSFLKRTGCQIVKSTYGRINQCYQFQDRQ